MPLKLAFELSTLRTSRRRPPNFNICLPGAIEGVILKLEMVLVACGIANVVAAGDNGSQHTYSSVELLKNKIGQIFGNGSVAPFTAAPTTSPQLLIPLAML